MNFKEMFGRYVSDELPEYIWNAEVSKPFIDQNSLFGSFVLTFDDFFSFDCVKLAETAIEKALGLSCVEILPNYPESTFSAECFPTIFQYLGRKNKSVFGIFSESDVNVDTNMVTVVLKNGGIDIIHSTKAEEQLTSLIENMFGFRPLLTIQGAETIDIGSDEYMQLMEEAEEEVRKKEIERMVEFRKLQEEAKANQPVRSGPKRSTGVGSFSVSESVNFDLPPRDGLPIYLETAKDLIGKQPHVRPFAIKDIEADGAEYTIWGEIFLIEQYVSRNGNVRWTIQMTDQTDSITLSLWSFPTNKSKDKGRTETLKTLKNGDCILVKGTYAYDSYARKNLFIPSTMASVKKHKKKDLLPEKRVELHAHTQMSQMDALTDVGKLVKRAAEWGHPAVAITDHGVVQSFPDACKAAHDLGDTIKIIYGVEGYYVDDREEEDVLKAPTYHIIILAKNQTGLKNLYKLITTSHCDTFNKRPRMTRSKIMEFREGLIIGSACEAGELFRAIVNNEPWDKICDIASFYDYLEVQPLGNNGFLLRESVHKKEVVPARCKSEEELIEFNKAVLKIGDQMGIPVCATGDVHFLDPEDSIFREVIQVDWEGSEHQPPLYFRTTQEMLDEFSYLSPEKAMEIVVTNPQMIADQVEVIQPVPNGMHPPKIEGAEEELENATWERAKEIYGDPLPTIVQERLRKELDGIIDFGNAVMYVIARRLVHYSEDNGYLVGSRGSVGSSLVASMAGISEVNPLPPHYVCKKCKHSEFITDGSVGSGFDLPPKDCPNCGERMSQDGHEIPFETFLGFSGDKVPDIDLNFANEFQTAVHRYTETLFADKHVFKAGTVSAIQDKQAFGYVKKYAETRGITLSETETVRLAQGILGVKKTTGQHPGGMVVVPGNMDAEDFTPIQHPADKSDSDVYTTHFAFQFIHDSILKLDNLGHMIPTMYKYLEENTGIPMTDVPMSDPNVYALFQSPEPLNITAKDIDWPTGTLTIPEMGTPLTSQMLIECQPKTFSDLIQISGLSHGTDVWKGNAQDLIKEGTCTISTVIGTRDSIMTYLIRKGLDPKRAFNIMENVRKGKIAKGQISPETWADMKAEMKEHDVPDWYIKSCEKIMYMFPKAHAAAYLIAALRMAWFKVYHPVEYYAAYFTVRFEDFDAELVSAGRNRVRQFYTSVEQDGFKASAKDKSVADSMRVVNEVMARNIEFLPVDIEKSAATRFTIEDGKIRMPFIAVKGLGANAAERLVAARDEDSFFSRADIQTRGGLSETLVNKLNELGALGNMPASSQMSFFDL